MKIIALPDLHSDLSSLFEVGEALSRADLVLLAGDLTNGGSAKEAEQVIQTVQKFNPSVLAIPGSRAIFHKRG